MDQRSVKSTADSDKLARICLRTNFCPAVSIEVFVDAMLTRLSTVPCIIFSPAAKSWEHSARRSICHFAETVLSMAESVRHRVRVGPTSSAGVLLSYHEFVCLTPPDGLPLPDFSATESAPVRAWMPLTCLGQGRTAGTWLISQEPVSWGAAACVAAACAT